jgi:hypothetical protein
MLSTVYTEYEWLPWLFNKAPNHYWDYPRNQKLFLDWAGKKLHVEEMKDWYRVGIEV